MAGKGNRAKLHHYVPQGYLRGFANEKGQVRVIPLDRSRKPFVSSVKNVAAQTHFHTIEELEEPDAFETALSEVEGKASRIIKAFEKKTFPRSEDDRWDLSYYMALQSVRGPDTRKTTEHLNAKLIRLEIGAAGRSNVGPWIKRNFGFDPSPEQEDRVWAEATQPDGPPISFSNRDHIQYMLDMAEELTPYFACRQWSLVRFERRALFTSDAPVSLIRDPEDGGWGGVGYMTAQAITFPLTRELGLLMNSPIWMLEGHKPDDSRVQDIRAALLRGEADGIQAGTTAREKLFNGHSAHSAREYIFCHPEDTKYVPEDLPEANLINVRAQGGLFDAEFDGDPWFAAMGSDEGTT